MVDNDYWLSIVRNWCVVGRTKIIYTKTSPLPEFMVGRFSIMIWSDVVRRFSDEKPRPAEEAARQV